VKCPRRL